MPNFEYALLALLVLGLLVNLGTVLFVDSPSYMPAARRISIAGIGLALDIVLIVCCLLYY